MTKLNTTLLKDLPIKQTVITDNDYVVVSSGGTKKLKIKDITKDIEKKAADLEEKATELSEQLDKKASEEDLKVERARINSFTKLSEGSTTGDAELIDGRIGADGISYENLGEAIRNNTKRLMDIVLKKSNNLLDPTTLELGEIGSWAGSTITTNSPATDKIRTKAIEIVEGNTYQFVRNGAPFTVPVFSLFDVAGKFIQTISAVNKTYTIPTGVNAKFIRGRFSGTDVSLYNGNNPATTLQFKVYTTNMTLNYEKYGYEGALAEKTVFDQYQNKIDNIVYFDDKLNMVEEKIKGVVSRQNLSIFTGGGFEHIDITCEAGERYLIGGYNSNSFDYSLYIFLNESNKVISYHNGTTATIINDLMITAPNGATRLIVNNDTTKNTLKVNKLVATDLQKKIIEVFNSADEIKNKSIDLEYENTQLKNRIFKLENENPFAFKNFDKGYITFVFDDGRWDWDKIASIFNEYGLKLCLSVPPSELDNNTNSLGTGIRKIKDICNDVVSRGGEILCHSMVSITKDNVNDIDVMTKQFKTNKQLLEKAGFDIRGIIMAGGNGQLLGGTVAEGGDIFQKWSSQYYDYSDRYGMSPNYYNPRSALKDGSSVIISRIQSAIANKKWSVFYGHTIDGSETGLDETVLRTVLQYCVDNNVSVVTYAHMYDNFGTTDLNKRLSALENK